MEDNLIAQAALFVWQLAKDFWEIYQLPIHWLYETGDVPFIVSATYYFFTLAAIAWLYLWMYLPSRWRNRRILDMKTAIDESYTPSDSTSSDDDYRIQYLRLLNDIRTKQDTIEVELAKLRLQQGK
ncbi:hypothetical protein V6X62_08915 [Spiribacter sp. 218]|uniref:hypothetical protein n=1 Tax=Spiribacter pallidus TaxID=1987936 RepID=UPI00349F2312